jgi:methionyl-tRNA formyltransferase
VRLAFLGTPAAAVPSLRALVGAGHEVVLVVSRADARRSRRGDPEPSPVKAAALELGIPVSTRPADAADAGAELGVVVAYGRLVRPEVLARLAMVNVHFSLLPRWRGAAPVERALLAGDATTGVCLMALEETLDTGGTYRCAEVAIGAEETADELRARLAGIGADLLVTALAEGLGEPRPQVGEVTYAAKIDPVELHLDWTAPTALLHRTVRVGRAWTTFRGRRLIIVAATPAGGTPDPGKVAGADGIGFFSPAGAPGTLEDDLVVTGDGALRLVSVQPEGRRPQPVDEWRRGVRQRPGERLGGS